jgi:aminocarboxymuconate-semialdehyde decarboxylase
MFDTTIALARIILSGLMDRYPNLTIVCPHVGGVLPYLIGRLDHQTMYSSVVPKI